MVTPGHLCTGSSRSSDEDNDSVSRNRSPVPGTVSMGSCRRCLEGAACESRLGAVTDDARGRRTQSEGSAWHRWTLRSGQGGLGGLSFGPGDFF